MNQGRDTLPALASYKETGCDVRSQPALFLLVGTTGFEPATPCSQGRCATRLRYVPVGPWRSRRGVRWSDSRKRVVAQGKRVDVSTTVLMQVPAAGVMGGPMRPRTNGPGAAFTRKTMGIAPASPCGPCRMPHAGGPSVADPGVHP